MNKTENKLGEVLRQARIREGLSQEKLAEQIGVSKRTITDIERNRGNPKFELLYLLVRELDLPLYSIFYPEASDNMDVKKLLIQELNTCSKQELNIILRTIQGLKSALKDERE